MAAERSGAASPAAGRATGAQRTSPPVDGDLVRSYLRDIGRVPLLSHEQEITLGRQVQELMALEELEQELTLRAGGLE
ncbi:sigma-70 factor domain-containing protein, partial [Vulcanococcus limneticus]|uniref:sigma-70 factor domain-containing protein n=1 Tax=Vulcanococcus limneticus TaxID=2170428 RepID=UPI00398BE716